MLLEDAVLDISSLVVVCLGAARCKKFSNRSRNRLVLLRAKLISLLSQSLSSDGFIPIGFSRMII